MTTDKPDTTRKQGDQEDIDWKNIDDKEWRERLGEERHYVMRQSGTEQAYSGQYYDYKDDGTYTCGACGAPLFDSKHKYNSGTGWPSFDRPIESSAIDTKPDNSYGMNRVEARCSRCLSHLGHVFDDGPTVSTGKRFCINSTALDFKPSEDY